MRGFIVLESVLVPFLVKQSSLLRKRKSWILYNYCVVAVRVLCLFLTVPWVSMQSVIVVFPRHARLLFIYNSEEWNIAKQGHDVTLRDWTLISKNIVPFCDIENDKQSYHPTMRDRSLINKDIIPL